MRRSRKSLIAALSFILVFVMVFNFFQPLQVMAESESALLDGEIIAFAELAPESENITVPLGTEEANLPFPDELSAAARLPETDGASDTAKDIEVSLPVKWSAEEYDKDVVGDYLFVVEVEDDYTISAELPKITITVEDTEADGNVSTAKAKDEIVSFAELSLEVAEITVPLGTAESDLSLPKKLAAMIKAGDTEIGVDVPVTWQPKTNYDGETVGEYVFKAAVDNTRYEVAATLPEIIVSIDERADAISANPVGIQATAALERVNHTITMQGLTFIGDLQITMTNVANQYYYEALPAADIHNGTVTFFVATNSTISFNQNVRLGGVNINAGTPTGVSSFYTGSSQAGSAQLSTSQGQPLPIIFTADFFYETPSYSDAEKYKPLTSSINFGGGSSVIPVENITLGASRTTVPVGETQSLVMTLSPGNATNTNVIWSSSNTAVATVDNGILTAKAPGTTRITVASVDGGKSAYLDFTVVPNSDTYNMGEETYSFENYGSGNCFGMSVTSAAYYLGLLDISEIGGSYSNDLYKLSPTARVKQPISYYQAKQGSIAINAIVAGGTAYKNNFSFYNGASDWTQVVNYVKSHEYDGKGTLQIGYRDESRPDGHAINFLRYSDSGGEPRIYAYDNNFPYYETYFYKDAQGFIRQGEPATFSGTIDCITLRSIPRYFSGVEDFDATRVIYASSNAISVENASEYLMDGDVVSGGQVMFEIPTDLDEVRIFPLSDNATFRYLDVEYSFGEVNDDTIGIFTLSGMGEGSTPIEPELNIVSNSIDDDDSGNSNTSNRNDPSDDDRDSYSDGGSSDSSSDERGLSGLLSKLTPPKEQWLNATTAAENAQDATKAGRDYVRTKYNGKQGVRSTAWAILSGKRYEHDTLDGNAVQVRLYVDKPELLAKDTFVSGWVKGADVDSIRQSFEKWYQNKVRVIHLDQLGLWGQDVKVAAKINLSGFDTKNLYFYAYDKAANSYKRLENPAYWIDTNGFLHFTTFYAGDIVISEEQLKKKL